MDIGCQLWNSHNNVHILYIHIRLWIYGLRMYLYINSLTRINVCKYVCVCADTDVNTTLNSEAGGPPNISAGAYCRAEALASSMQELCRCASSRRLYCHILDLQNAQSYGPYTESTLHFPSFWALLEFQVGLHNYQHHIVYTRGIR